MEQLITQLLSTIRSIWKYRWYSMVVAWAIVVISFPVIYTLPNNYQTSARVFVDTQSILKPLLASMATIPDVEQQVSIMSKTLISRPNVERVIRMVDMDIKTQSLKDKETLVNNLVTEIKITGTASNDIYTISYSNADPKLAKDVVQSLLTIFIEGSFGNKKQDSANAVRFIDEQIKQYEERLLQAENTLKEFKLKNSSLMLGNEGEYVGKLAQAEEQLSQARLELTEAERARDSIKRQISGEVSGLGDGARPVSAAVNPELSARIEALNKTLDGYRLQFTEDHPDVVATKRLLAQLEARRTQEAKAVVAGTSIGRIDSPVLQQLKIALSDTEARVAAMRARVAEYSGRVTRAKALGNAVPEIEAQFAQLNRDYQVNKANYEKLIASRDAARLSGDLSATSEMISFRIVDPPTVPIKPVGPNRPRLFVLAFVAALVVAAGIAFLMSQIRPTFVSLAHLREVTGLPVLGSVSMNWTEHERKRHKQRLIAFCASFVGLLVVYGGAMGALLLKN